MCHAEHRTDLSARLTPCVGLRGTPGVVALLATLACASASAAQGALASAGWNVVATSRSGTELPFDFAALRTWTEFSRDTLLAFDPQDGVLRLFAPDLRAMRAIGRRGDGPGELRVVSHVKVGRGEVVVTDAMLRRRTRFSRGWRLREALAVEARAEPCRSAQPFGELLDGTMLLTEAVASTSTADDASLALLRWDASGSSCTRLIQLKAGRPYLRAPAGGGVLYQPFDEGALLALSPAGDRVYVVERRQLPKRSGVDDGVTAVLRTYDVRTGSWSERVLSWPATAVTPAARDSAWREARRRLIGIGVPSGEVDAVLSSQLKLPRNRPAVTSLLVASDGGVWLERPSRDRRATYTVVANPDASVTEVRFGEGERVLAVGTHSVWVLAPAHEDLRVVRLARSRGNVRR